MNKREPKSAAIYHRVTPELKEKFHTMASRYGTPSEVLRELITAFIEGRITILPPEGKESLYESRK